MIRDMPAKKKPELTEAERATWTDLLDAGERFRALAPWQWMGDQPLFGVRDAPGAPTLYVSVCGALGEVFGACLYDGPEGWASFERLEEQLVDPLDAPYSQHAMTLFFWDREQVEPQFRALLRALGRSPRGRGAWPEALVHRPGFAPRLPTTEEAALMARAVAEAAATCERTRTERLPVDGSLLVRCEGRDVWEERPRAAEPHVRVEPLDELVLRRLDKVERRGGRWIGDHAHVPAVVLESPHPYYPRHVLWIDERSGMILDMDLVAPGKEPEAHLRARLIDLMTRHGAPDTIVVRRETTARALEPLRGKVRIELDPEPEMLMAIMEGLHASMRGR